MSFSQPTLQNPSTKFINFKGDTGVFQYYDKEKEENIKLDTPFYFIVLDELNTIKGFSDDLQSGIYSNEIHSLVDEIFRVKSFKGGLSIVGKYDDIKSEIKSAGGKFAKSIYALCFNENFDTEIINFQLSGAAFSAWLDFKFDAHLHSIAITGETTDEKKGSINYKKPVFKRYNIKKELIDRATQADVELQKYLKQYKKKINEQQIEKEEKTGNEVFHETNWEQDKNETYDNSDSQPEYEQNDLPF